MRGAELGQQRREERRQRVGCRDTHDPARTQVLACQPPLQKLDLGQHARRGGDGGFAGGCRRIAVAGAVEQPHAEPLLHPAEPPEHVGMIQPELAGGRRKRAVLADCLQQPEIVDREAALCHSQCLLANTPSVLADYTRACSAHQTTGTTTMTSLDTPLSSTDTRLANGAATVLRIALGVMFLSHSLILKLYVFTLAGNAAFFQKLGLPAW